MVRSAAGSNITSASVISSASIQSSPRTTARPWLSVWAFPWPPLSLRRCTTRPGYSISLALTTRGVSSVLASSTTYTRSDSGGYSAAISLSMDPPMTAPSFQAGISTAVLGKIGSQAA
jgi:hypothetical protein